MIEVAIVSMEQALVADGEAVPDGSAAFEREPLADAEARMRDQRAAELAAAEPAGRGRAGRGRRRRRADGPRRDRATRSRRMIDDALREVVARYEAVQDELALPGDGDRSRRAPTARPGARPARAGRLGGPPARAHADRAGRGARDARRRVRRGAPGDGPRRGRPARGRRGPPDRRAQGPPAARATRPTTATSSSRSAPGPAARRRRCSPPSCSGCTSAYADKHRFTDRCHLAQRDGHRRDQGGDRRGQRRRRLLPPEVRGRRSTASSASRRPSPPGGSTPRPRRSSCCPRSRRTRS